MNISGLPYIRDILESVKTLGIEQLSDFEKLVDIKFWINTLNEIGAIYVSEDVIAVFENLEIHSFSDLHLLMNITILS